METEVHDFDKLNYHDSFEIDRSLRSFVVIHDFSGELRNVMSGITLAGDVDFPVVVPRKPVKPLNEKLK